MDTTGRGSSPPDVLAEARLVVHVPMKALDIGQIRRAIGRLHDGVAADLMRQGRDLDECICRRYATVARAGQRCCVEIEGLADRTRFISQIEEGVGVDGAESLTLIELSVVATVD